MRKSHPVEIETAYTRPVAHEAIFGSALRLGRFDVPCDGAVISRDDGRDLWTVKAYGVPLDALRPLRAAIGPLAREFEVCLTDHAGRVHEGRGRIPRTAPQELGYRLSGDDLSFLFEGRIE
jgi:hypothetical protein